VLADGIRAGTAEFGKVTERTPMITPTDLGRHVRFVLLFVAVILLPLSVGAQPVLSVSPTSVSAQANVGANAPSQTVQVNNAGNRALKWSVVQGSPSWVTVSPTRGTNTGTLTLSFETSSLPQNTYQTSFQIVEMSCQHVGNHGTSSSATSAAGTRFGVWSAEYHHCPAGAVDLWPGSSIPYVVSYHPARTTYCVRAGVHSLTSAIRPKTGDTFVGEYGAVLDGSGWTTSDGTQAAFRAHNEDIDYVTIRNLVIRNMPQNGIHAYYWMSDHWTIEYNEIASNKWGLLFAPDFTIRNNYIHHNVGSNPSSSNPAERGGGYGAVRADNTILERNEIAYNGPEQKVGLSANVTFRNNFVHHNLGDGIWYDSNPNAGALIEGNRVEDNGRNGIFFEAGIGVTIRNNTVRRHPWDAVMISMSQNAQIYNNSLEGNFGGIEYFLNCDVLSGGDDVKNNAAYDNTVVVGTQSYSYASGLASTSSCTATQLAPYLNGSKNLTFSRNTYRVPSVTGRYLIWGGWKFWNEWQALGHDVGGSLSQ
jgi:parallel beta-helix repeat protein